MVVNQEHQPSRPFLPQSTTTDNGRGKRSRAESVFIVSTYLCHSSGRLFQAGLLRTEYLDCPGIRPCPVLDAVRAWGHDIESRPFGLSENFSGLSGAPQNCPNLWPNQIRIKEYRREILDSGNEKIVRLLSREEEGGMRKRFVGSICDTK